MFFFVPEFGKQISDAPTPTGRHGAGQWKTHLDFGNCLGCINVNDMIVLSTNVKLHFEACFKIKKKTQFNTMPTVFTCGRE